MNNENIAIVGDPGSGNLIVFKSALSDLLADNKKVLLLEFTDKEFKQITADLCGDYISYEKDTLIDYRKNLTTISFQTEIDGKYVHPDIEHVLTIIKDAESKGIEAVLIDEAEYLLKDCERLISNVNAQLIAITRCDLSILTQKHFNKLFKTLFLVREDYYKICQLLSFYNADIYNADISIIENLRGPQYHFKNVIIRDGKVSYISECADSEEIEMLYRIGTKHLKKFAPRNMRKKEKGVITIAFQSINAFFIGLFLGGVIVYLIMNL